MPEAFQLRSVDSSGKEPPSGIKNRKQPRTRPSKSLPTDRMKFEAQQRVLHAIGRLSGPTKRPVDAQMLSQGLGGEVSHYTVGLSNNFFLDSGWLEKRGRGEYAASDALVEFARMQAVDPSNVKAALKPLASTASQSWYWQAIEPQLRHGHAVAETEVLVVLMQEAGVGEAHLPQLRMLLQWLRFMGLVDAATDGALSMGWARKPDTVNTQSPGGAVSTGESSRGENFLEQAGDVQDDGDGVSVVTAAALPSASSNSDSSRQKSTKDQAPDGSEAVLAFDFSFRLTADDLARLSPDQIREVFAAVGMVMALKNS